MGGYKRIPTPDCLGKPTEKYAPITKSLLNSNALRALNARQQMLYVHCAFEIGKRGTVNKPGTDNPMRPDFQNCRVFYMNWAKAREFGIYGEKSNHTFYNDIKALINAGFIECLYHGKQTREKSVYKLSTKWKRAGEYKKQKGCVATTQGVVFPQHSAKKAENGKSPIKWDFSKNPGKNDAEKAVFPQHSAEMPMRPDNIEENRLLPN